MTTPAGAAPGNPARPQQSPMTAPVTAVPATPRTTRSADGAAAAPRVMQSGRGKRSPRITTLQLKRVDPWTTLKVSLIVSIVMFFVWMIAIGLLYGLFSSLDVITRINDGWATVSASSDTTTGAPAADLITAGRVFGIGAVVGAINIVVFTALSTVFSFVYNAAAGMAGGVELTLGERD